MDLEQKTSKKLKEYNCETCSFITCSKNDYRRHLDTRKHVVNAGSNQNEPEITQKTQEHQHNCMFCDKIYKSKSGLWNHKKKCSQKTQIIENPPDQSINLNVLILDLLKQNKELQNQIIELSKEKSITTNNNTNTNSNNTQNNNHFNLQFFLNETCKDAITADQFVKDIQKCSQISIESSELSTSILSS
jgi:hypothetical protein